MQMLFTPFTKVKNIQLQQEFQVMLFPEKSISIDYWESLTSQREHHWCPDAQQWRRKSLAFVDMFTELYLLNISWKQIWFLIPTIFTQLIVLKLIWHKTVHVYFLKIFNHNQMLCLISHILQSQFCVLYVQININHLHIISTLIIIICASFFSLGLWVCGQVWT